ncbi:MAG: tRNA (guanosine(37)-N1)-methyltransferase TrmD [Firmicutes bacterium]|nr:tRNA (guanosine(37)-N1)-methyltransferase TrmD [Bacillota bacterium]
MLIHLLTIHPALCYGPLEEAILGRAREKGLLDIRVVNIRDFAPGRHQITDDYPYGGGVGLVMKPEPIFLAVEHAIRQGPYREVVPPEGLTGPPPGGRPRILLMDPAGRRFDQAYARELAQEEHLIFICGRYEGVDERVRLLVTDAVSIGDYVLTGGELPALVMIDAISRMVPGVLGDQQSAQDDSFATGLLEGPSYTRPPEFRGLRVPEVLLRGDHRAIARWRRKEALRRTRRLRPDLLLTAPLTEEDRQLLAEIEAEEGA